VEPAELAGGQSVASANTQLYTTIPSGQVCLTDFCDTIVRP
jgi:hypothetical protein